jgi:hypothetical protein
MTVEEILEIEEAMDLLLEYGVVKTLTMNYNATSDNFLLTTITFQNGETQTYTLDDPTSAKQFLNMVQVYRNLRSFL